MEAVRHRGKGSSWTFRAGPSGVQERTKWASIGAGYRAEQRRKRKKEGLPNFSRIVMRQQNTQGRKGTLSGGREGLNVGGESANLQEEKTQMTVERRSGPRCHACMEKGSP